MDANGSAHSIEIKIKEKKNATCAWRSAVDVRTRTKILRRCNVEGHQVHERLFEVHFTPIPLFRHIPRPHHYSQLHKQQSVRVCEHNGLCQALADLLFAHAKVAAS